MDVNYERKVPLITAHRGSMWYFPEHTIAAYYYAFFEGADFIDVDLHPTKDGTFIAYHDPVITPEEAPSILDFPEIFTKERRNQRFHNKMSLRTFEKG